MDTKKERKEKSKEISKEKGGENRIESIKKDNTRARVAETLLDTEPSFGYWQVQIQLGKEWVNCIAEYVANADGDKGYVPKTFPTEFAAQAALQERLQSEHRAFNSGDAGYHPSASKYRLSFTASYH